MRNDVSSFPEEGRRVAADNVSTINEGPMDGNPPASGHSRQRGAGIWAALALILLAAVVLLVMLTQCVPRVPDVVGLETKAASAKLVDAGYKVGNVSVVILEKTAPGRVGEQAPSGGSMLSKGRSVDLIVARGSEMVKVPDVLGNDTPAAQLLLSNKDLKMSVSGQYSDTVPAGAVISQYPAGGSDAPIQSDVEVVVSLGLAPAADSAGGFSASGGAGGGQASVDPQNPGPQYTPQSGCTAVYHSASVWASDGAIYVRLTPGGATRKLTGGSSWDSDPKLSPSGKFVVFSRASSSGAKTSSIGSVCLTNFHVNMLSLPVSRPDTNATASYGTPVFAPSPTGTAPDSDWLVTPQYLPNDPASGGKGGATLLVTNVPINSTWTSWNNAFRPTQGIALGRSGKAGCVKVTTPPSGGSELNFNVYTGMYTK